MITSQMSTHCATRSGTLQDKRIDSTESTGTPSMETTMNMATRRIGAMRPALYLLVAFLAVTLAFFVTADRAMAQNNCLDDLSPLNGLNCTANDVGYSDYGVISGPSSCMEGEQVQLTLELRLKPNALIRYDLGIFVATDGGNALVGSCQRDWLSPVAALNNSNLNEVSRTGPFYNADGDSCGDIRSTATGVVNGVSGWTFKVIGPITITCEDFNNDGFLDVATVTSWDISTASVCTNISQTLPPSVSKCKAASVRVGNVVFRRSANVEIIKDVISPLGAQETGRFNLQANAITRLTDAYDTNLDADAAGPRFSTGSFLVDAGTSLSPGALVTVGELAGANTDLADYNSAVECVNRAGGGEVANNPDGTSLTWTILPDTDVVCTITNRRKPTTIQVNKELIPGTDHGRFDMRIDGPGTANDFTASNQTNGGSTGVRNVISGTYAISEVGGSEPLTNLADYVSNWSCSLSGRGPSPVVASGSGTTIAPIQVNSGESLVCTFTNDRMRGTLDIRKDVVPPDHSQWTLSASGPSPIDDHIVGTGGSTLATAVDTGAYTVSEAGDLTLYKSSYACVGDDGFIPVSGAGSSIGITIADRQDVVCTFTNTRLTGNLRIVKDVNGAVTGATYWHFDVNNDIGHRDLTVQDAGDSDTGFFAVPTGTYAVVESAIDGTDANLFGTTASCEDGIGNPLGSFTGQALSGIVVGEDDDITCTFVNTRRTGTVTVDKVVVAPAGYTDPGLFNLQINGTTAGTGANVGDGGSTGPIIVNTGLVSVGEIAGNNTSLSDYITDISCNNGQSAQNATSFANIDVTDGQNLLCIITNTRRTATIQVTKLGIGGSGIFDFTGAGAPVSTSFSLSTTTTLVGPPSRSSASQQFIVPSGTYIIAEGTLPAGWDFTQLSCTSSEGSIGLPGSAPDNQHAVITIANGGSVNCTWENTKRGTIVVTKAVNWNGTPVVPDQEFDICIVGPRPEVTERCQRGLEGQFVFGDLTPGAYAVYEASLNPSIGWLVARSSSEPTLLPGGIVNATVTNTRIHGAIQIVFDNGISTRWTRLYSWDLLKTVTPTDVAIFDGQSTELNYTVTTTRTEEPPQDMAIFGDVRFTNSSTQTATLINEPEGLLPGGLAAVLVCDRLIPAGSNTPEVIPAVTVWPFEIPPSATLICRYDTPVSSFITGMAVITVTIDNVAQDVYTTTSVLEEVNWVNPTTVSSQTISVNDTRVAGWNFPQDDDTPYSVTYPQSLQCSDLGNIIYNDGASLNNPYENTATVVGSTNINPSTAVAYIDCYRISVEKSAVPTYTVDYEWSIEKRVDPASLTLYEDETGTLTYTITVTKEEGHHRDFAASGVITVTNPNPDADAMLQSVTDVLGTTNVSANCGSLLVPAGGTLTCDYDTTLAATSQSILLNTATAEHYGKPYTGTAVVDFASVLPALLNDSVYVTDTQVVEPFGPFDLNKTLVYTTTQSCEQFTDYIDGSGHILVSNTAQVTGTEMSDTAQAQINCVQYGDIQVTKTVSDSIPNDWNFEFTLEGAPDPTAQTVSSSTPTASWNNLIPGATYTLQEATPGSEWIQTEIACEVEPDPGHGFIPLTDQSAAPGFQIQLLAGENIRCSVENIATASLAVQKVYIGPSTDWLFVFSLHEMGSPDSPVTRTLTSTQPIGVWENLVPNRAYDFMELNPGPNYQQGEINCMVNDVLLGDPATDGAGIILTPKPGDVISCTLVNTERGTVTIEKQTIPDESQVDPMTAFTFISSLPHVPDFTLTDGQTRTLTVDAGTYTASEVVPMGWDLETITCDDDNSTGVNPTATINVAPGEDVTCVFENTLHGTIIVETITNPAFHPAVFSFATNAGDPFTLTTDTAFPGENAMVLDLLHPGVYSVTENPHAGWGTTGATCDNGDSPNNITLDAGVTVRCTFSNALLSKLVVEKVVEWNQTTPNPNQSFNICVEGADANECVDVTDGNSYEWPNILPGVYTVTEVAPSGYELVSTVTSPATLQPGETVTVTVNNSRNYGQIVVKMVTQPANRAQLFPFTASWSAGGFALSGQGGSDTHNSGNLPTGEYSVQEMLPVPGWTLASVTCDDSQPLNVAALEPNNPSQTIFLDPGEVITCVYTNVAALSSVGERVWLDINPDGTSTPVRLAGDGLQNDPSEAGVANVTVALWSPGPDGIRGTADDVKVQTTTTDADGKYRFNSVTPGFYYIVFVKSGGGTAWSSHPNVGDDPNIDNDVTVDPANANRAVTPVFELDIGVIDLSRDAAVVDISGTGSSDIGDRVWNDLNRNGIQDAGEPGIPGVVVELFMVTSDTTVADVSLDTRTTNASGHYLFAALDPGTHYLAFTVPLGFFVAQQNAGSDDGTDSDINSSGRTQDFMLPPLTSDLIRDAGMYAAPTSDDKIDEPGTIQSVWLPVVTR